MTGQIPDVPTYRSSTYDLAGIKGDLPFNPSQYGVAPSVASTACHRGYKCHYAVDRRRLLLKTLDLCDQRPPPALLGVSPEKLPYDFGFFGHCYPNLRLSIPYSGGLLIAKGFIDELYVHMGFQPAWKYSTVYELQFYGGALTSEVDRSQQAARVRERMCRSRDWEEPSDHRAIGEWIAATFSRDYPPWSDEQPAQALDGRQDPRRACRAGL